MSRSGIIVSKNYLLAEGIRSLICRDLQNISFTISEKIDLKGIIHFEIIVAESTALSDTAAYLLERVRKVNQGATLILLCEKIPNEQILPYIDTYILFADSAKIIQSKILKGIKSSVGSNGQNISDSLLSERESEVLRYVALGYTNRDISNKLTISTHTVITHRKNITAKLGIKTIAGLAIYAVINGIISTEEMNA